MTVQFYQHCHSSYDLSVKNEWIMNVFYSFKEKEEQWSWERTVTFFHIFNIKILTWVVYFADVLQTLVNMKADASSPGMILFVSARTPAIKEKFVTCVSAGFVISVSSQLITSVPLLYFSLIITNLTSLLKQPFIKSHARPTGSAASTGLETTPSILILVGRWNHLRCTAKWSVRKHWQSENTASSGKC